MDTFQNLQDAVSSISAKGLLPDFEPSAYSMIVAQLGEESSRIKNEIEGIEAQIQLLRGELDSIWADDRSEEYELSSVFMHRGELCVKELSDTPTADEMPIYEPRSSGIWVSRWT